MATAQFLPFGKTRAQRFIATVAAAVATASLVAAFQVSSARAATEPATLLPPAYTVASADDSNRSDGPRGRMRERAQERAQDRAQDRERPATDKHLTNDQMRDIVAGNLALRGNANLKVGKVTAKEDGVVSVEIVTKTGALVDTRDMSTKTGLPAGLERRFGQMRHGMMAQRGGHRFARGTGEKARDLALTTDQAKKLAEARLIMQGNPHVKVGAVKEKDADTISVDIVASDNSLVTQQLIDRHSGRPQRPFGERRS